MKYIVVIFFKSINTEHVSDFCSRSYQFIVVLFKDAN